ncbi:MAG: HXXEE domain-containing protein [Coriobacteriales bacterium]|jgi:hypothetical protein
MSFFRNNWYRLTFIAFVALAFCGPFLLREASTVQMLLYLSLMALPLHQFEEYQFPGGGPVVINRYFYHAPEELFRHYPGNWNSCMVVNLLSYVFYILALALPDLTWLGTATMFFNLYQVLCHGIQMNVQMRTWYNPGMATAMFLLLPIAIAYIVEVTSLGLVGGIEWLYAVLSFMGIAACCVVAPVQLMKRKDSPFDVPEWQVEQLERVRAVVQISRSKKDGEKS